MAGAEFVKFPSTTYKAHICPPLPIHISSSNNPAGPDLNQNLNLTWPDVFPMSPCTSLAPCSCFLDEFIQLQASRLVYAMSLTKASSGSFRKPPCARKMLCNSALICLWLIPLYTITCTYSWFTASSLTTFHVYLF